MIRYDNHPSGRHFLQIPGPTNVPDRVLRAIDRPTIDHRGPEFARLGRSILDRIGTVFQTKEPVVVYAASGTGAWEAALVNTLSAGDAVLMAETGHFALLWKRLAERLGLAPAFLPGDWRHGADVDAIYARLADDRAHAIKAVCVVHNETSTGAVSDIPRVRAAIDRAGHPALLLVDTISSLASIDYRHDEWGVDVTVAGSQKGLMLPPGLSFNAVSPKARAASKHATLPRAYWGWDEIIESNRNGYWRGRRRRICSTASTRRSISCSRRACRASSRATRATVMQRAPPCAHGTSKYCARIRRSTATRSLRC